MKLLDELNLQEAQRAESYADSFCKYQSSDRGSFARIIEITLNFGLTASELADAIEVSKPTISRWASGKTLPIPLVQKAIVNELAAIMRTRAAEIRARSVERSYHRKFTQE